MDIIDTLWNHRNNVVFKSATSDPNALMYKSRSLTADVAKVKGEDKEGRRAEAATANQRWSKPSAGEVKVSSDAAFSNGVEVVAWWREIPMTRFFGRGRTK